LIYVFFISVSVANNRVYKKAALFDIWHACERVTSWTRFAARFRIIEEDCVEPASTERDFIAHLSGCLVSHERDVSWKQSQTNRLASVTHLFLISLVRHWCLAALTGRRRQWRRKEIRVRIVDRVSVCREWMINRRWSDAKLNAASNAVYSPLNYSM